MLLALLAMVSAASVADRAAPVALNPPLDVPLLLTISDERLLADRTAIRFSMRYRIAFYAGAGQGDLRATVTVLGVECVGPAVPCGRYRAATEPTIGQRREVAIDAAGHATPLHAVAGARELTASAEAARLIDNAGPDMLADLAVGEIAEGLRFVGTAIDTAPQGIRRTVTLDRDHALIVDNSIDHPPGGTALRRRVEQQLDRTSGLMVESRAIVSLGDESATVVSDRRWTLRPE